MSSGTLNHVSETTLSGPAKRIHSCTRFDSTQFLSCRPDAYGGNWTKVLMKVNGSTLQENIQSSTNISARGMHYNPTTKKVIYANGANGNLEELNLSTEFISQAVVSTDGTYKTMIGDISNTYIFGWKMAADGSTNQLFRADADGTNEISVDTTSLFGSNEEMDGFTSDYDNQIVYFHDRSTRTLRGVSWDLSSNFTTHGLTLAAENAGSLAYSRGFIYYGGIAPGSTALDSGFYRYNPSNGEIYTIAGVQQSIRNGPNFTADLFIHPDLNALIVSGESATRKLVGTDFDYYETFITTPGKFPDGVSVQWTSVSGATSYQVVVNGSPTVITADTEYSARGYADGTMLDIVIQSSTDDVSFTNAPYRSIKYHVQEAFNYTESPPNFLRIAPRGATTFLDPYNPTDIVFKPFSHQTVWKYNISTDTATELNSYTTYPDMFGRNYQTKDIIMLTINTLTNLGPDCVELDNYTSVHNLKTARGFYTHPSQIQSFEVSFDGTIYFVSGNEVWSMSADGTGAQILFTTTETAGPIASDPHDPDSLVYVDGENLKHRVISTGVTNDVIVGNMSGTLIMVLLNGVVYFNYYNKSSIGGYVRVNTDGTNMYGWTPESSATFGFGFVMDTVNKASYTLDTNKYHANVDGSIADLPPDPSLFLATPRPLSIKMTWSPVSGATSYGVRYSVGDVGIGDKIVSVRQTTQRSHSVRNLSPGTLYSVYLYYSTSSAVPSILVGSGSFTTLSNTAGNHDKADFGDESGKFSLADLDPTSLDKLGEVMNDLFTTGDVISFKLPTGNSVSTKFVRRGETTTITDGSSVSLPFTANSGAGQTASLTLSDSTTVSITFDETTQEMSVGGQVYTSGQSFVLDGKKVTLYDV